jgi:ABC-type nickel/cobalt efflux system permease component RcnA
MTGVLDVEGVHVVETSLTQTTKTSNRNFILRMAVRLFGWLLALLNAYALARTFHAWSLWLIVPSAFLIGSGATWWFHDWQDRCGEERQP